MKTSLKIVAAILLLFNGVGAIWGGSNLLSDPGGTSMGWTIEMLKNTPFKDFFIPGLILFTTNGLFSFGVLTMMYFGYKKYEWLIMVQGAILTGWIVIQMILLRSFVPLHAIMGSVGLLLIASGFQLFRIYTSENEQNKDKKRNILHPGLMK